MLNQLNETPIADVHTENFDDTVLFEDLNLSTIEEYGASLSELPLAENLNATVLCRISLVK